jgi:hypothetical protein
MKSAVSFSLFALLLPLVSSLVAYPKLKTGQCKTLPDTPEWPVDADWAALKTAVKGRLLRPDPPAAPCHQASPLFSVEVCETVTRGFRDSAWHAKHPTSNMWQNYNNYSCMPSASGTCTNSGYPLYVVEAQEASDVKAAVDFAREHNIRLNIKSTGHDFLGR